MTRISMRATTMARAAVGITASMAGMAGMAGMGTDKPA